MDFPEALLARVPERKRAALIEVLAQDPRPGYRREDDGKRYGVMFAGCDVRFCVDGEVVRVVDVVML